MPPPLRMGCEWVNCITMTKILLLHVQRALCLGPTVGWFCGAPSLPIFKAIISAFSGLPPKPIRMQNKEEGMPQVKSLCIDAKSVQIKSHCQALCILCSLFHRCIHCLHLSHRTLVVSLLLSTMMWPRQYTRATCTDTVYVLENSPTYCCKFNSTSGRKHLPTRAARTNACRVQASRSNAGSHERLEVSLVAQEFMVCAVT